MLVLVLLGAFDDLMCFWWCENNLCIVYGWIFGLACVRAGEICYARLSGLFFAQTRSSRLSENGSNSPPLVSSARLSEGLSFGQDRLAWARTRSALYFQSRLSKSFSLERETPVAWARDPFRLSESSLAWARLTAELFKYLYAPMIDLFTLLKHENMMPTFYATCLCFL